MKEREAGKGKRGGGGAPGVKEEGRAGRERNEGGEAGMGEHEVREGVTEEGRAGREEMKAGRQLGESMK